MLAYEIKELKKLLIFIVRGGVGVGSCPARLDLSPDSFHFCPTQSLSYAGGGGGGVLLSSLMQCGGKAEVTGRIFMCPGSIRWCVGRFIERGAGGS